MRSPSARATGPAWPSPTGWPSHFVTGCTKLPPNLITSIALRASWNDTLRSPTCATAAASARLPSEAAAPGGAARASEASCKARCTLMPAECDAAARQAWARSRAAGRMGEMPHSPLRMLLNGGLASSQRPSARLSTKPRLQMAPSPMLPLSSSCTPWWPPRSSASIAAGHRGGG